MTIRETIFERYFLISLGVPAIVSILSIFFPIEIKPISPSLAAGIFTVIIGTTGTLFSILALYGEVITIASEKSDRDKNYINKIRRTFSIPVKTSVLGFLIAVFANTYQINAVIVPEKYSLMTNSEAFSTIMLFLLLYSMMSFWGAFSFIIRTIIAREAKSGNNPE